MFRAVRIMGEVWGQLLRLIFKFAACRKLNCLGFLPTYLVESIPSPLASSMDVLYFCCPGSALLIEFHQIAQPISLYLCAGLESDRWQILAVD